MDRFNTRMDELIYEQTGYRTFTTFALDFEIADTFGEKAVRDTFDGASYWITDYKYWTELVLILNWNIWKHQNDSLGLVYDSLWRKAEEMFADHYQDKDSDDPETKEMKETARQYYYSTLD